MSRERFAYSVERDRSRVTLAVRELAGPRRLTLTLRVASLAALVAQLRCAVSDSEEDGWSSSAEIEVESCS